MLNPIRVTSLEDVSINLTEAKSKCVTKIEGSCVPLLCVEFTLEIV